MDIKRLLKCWFLKIINHFFHLFRVCISEIIELRNPSYISYAQTDLVYIGILKNLCNQNILREMEIISIKQTVSIYYVLCQEIRNLENARL